MELGGLAPAFTMEEARAFGLRKDQVYALLESDEIERIGRGVYLRSGSVDPAFASLAAARAVHEEATLCLTSALVHHELSDAIPFGADIALPRGMRHPAGFAHVAWHSFSATTFHIGREFLELEGGMLVAIYSAERTIVDCFRLLHQEGADVTHDALRRWLRRRGSSPGALLKTAAAFPAAHARIGQALEILL